MSTIVVVKKAGKVCIAADSLTSFGDLSMGSDYDADSDKILQCDNAYLGIVGSAAHHLVMQSIIQQPEIKMDFSTRMTIFESFRQLHPMLKEKYFLNAKDEDDDPYESTQIDALIASPHGIFGVHSLREVCEYKKFWAIGSGSEYALGAMFAVYDIYDSVDKIAEAGVRAGAEFNNATAMPMTSYTVDLVKLKAATG
jgi:ATP-dependent protease HslVU (ClpYQ) peptidase subunit